MPIDLFESLSTYAAEQPDDLAIDDGCLEIRYAELITCGSCCRDTWCAESGNGAQKVVALALPQKFGTTFDRGAGRVRDADTIDDVF